MHTTDTHGVDGTAVAEREREAFYRTAKDRDAVDIATIPAYGLEAVHAHATALGIALRLQPYRDRIAALPDTDIRHLDKLVDYANALMFAHETLKIRAERTRQLPALSKEGLELREILLAYADVLAKQKLVSQKVVDDLRAGTGYRDLVADLNFLTRLAREEHERSGHHLPVRPEQVARAKEIAHTMTLQLGIRDDPDLDHDTLVQARHKAGYLLIRSHAEIRRAMEYIRYHEGDAAKLVPSLFVPRKSTGKKKAAADQANPHADFAAMHDAFHAAHDDEHDALDPLDNPFVDA